MPIGRPYGAPPRAATGFLGATWQRSAVWTRPVDRAQWTGRRGQRPYVGASRRGTFRPRSRTTLVRGRRERPTTHATRRRQNLSLPGVVWPVILATNSASKMVGIAASVWTTV